MILGGRRSQRLDGAAIAPRERVLAVAASGRGTVAGTRDALYLPGGIRLPWHLVEAADWDHESELLTVREVGTYGQERPEHRLALGEPDRLLQLVRERVTASIVLTRHVSVTEGRGVTVIGRRPTDARRPLAWFVAYDVGLDPADPEVESVVDAALAAARAEVGSL